MTSEFLALSLKFWILRHEASTPRSVARISNYTYKVPKCEVRDLGHESSIPSHDSSVPSHEARYLRFRTRGQDFLNFLEDLHVAIALCQELVCKLYHYQHSKSHNTVTF